MTTSCKKFLLICSISLSIVHLFSGCANKKVSDDTQLISQNTQPISNLNTPIKSTEKDTIIDKVDYKKLLPENYDWKIAKTVTVDLNSSFTIVSAYCERDQKPMLGQFFVFSKENKLLWKSTEFETSSILDQDVYILKAKDKALVFGEYIWGGARGMMYSGVAFTIESNNIVKEENSDILLGLDGDATVTNNSIVLKGELIETDLELSFSDGIYKETSLNDDSSTSFNLDVGDKKHSFMISMKPTPLTNNDNEIYDSTLTISISDANNTTSPYQIIEDYTTGTLFKEYKVEDVNFDGYLDFYYVDSQGT